MDPLSRTLKKRSDRDVEWKSGHSKKYSPLHKIM